MIGVAQSALSPAGPQSGAISSLWWLYHWIFVVIYLLVIAFMLIAIARKRAASDDVEPQVNNDPRVERRMTSVVSTLVGITVVILFVLLIADFLSGRKLFAMTKQ